MEHVVLEIVKVNKSLSKALKDFFLLLTEEGVQKYFHPHPFTNEEANRISIYSGIDQYYVMVENDVIIGYGMLRGWDQGFDIPSLGLVISPAYRGLGLGHLMLSFLHFVAWKSGAKRIMLKVYTKNIAAKQLYEKVGYIFQPERDKQLIGYLDLDFLYAKNNKA